MIRYVTRWALSTGIREVEGEYTEDGKYFTSSKGYPIFVSSREAHISLAEAVFEAKRMAAKRAKNLRAQAEKLESPDWQPKVVRREVKQ